MWSSYGRQQLRIHHTLPHTHSSSFSSVSSFFFFFFFASFVCRLAYRAPIDRISCANFEPLTNKIHKRHQQKEMKGMMIMNEWKGKEWW
jgi:hypothetical protein